MQEDQIQKPQKRIQGSKFGQRFCNANVQFNCSQYLSTKETGKSIINVKIGDPSLYDGFYPDPRITSLFGKGYPFHTLQTSQAERPDLQALAQISSTKDWVLSPENIIPCLGASDGLRVVLSAFCSPGDNIVTASSSFSYTRMFAEQYQVDPRIYQRNYENGYTFYSDQLESLIDERTKYINVCDPCNPTGVIMNIEKKKELLEIARRRRLPIVVDQVYQKIIYPGEQMVQFSELCKEYGVPVINIFSLSKMLSLPGVRVGWIALYGQEIQIQEIKLALKEMQKFCGQYDSICQQNIPEILKVASENCIYEENSKQSLERVNFFVEKMEGIQGFQVVRPQAGYFGIIKIDFQYFDEELKDSCAVFKALVDQQNVHMQPAEAFHSSGFLRFTTYMDFGSYEKLAERLRIFSLDNKRKM